MQMPYQLRLGYACSGISIYLIVLAVEYVLRQGIDAISTVESGAGAPTVGSGGISVAFAPVLSPAPMVAFPAPAPRTRRADFRHRALQWDHAPRTQATKANDSKDEVAARVSAAEAARLPPFLPRRARRPSSLSTP